MTKITFPPLNFAPEIAMTSALVTPHRLIELTKGRLASGDAIFIPTAASGTPGNLRNSVFRSLNLSEEDAAPNPKELMAEGYSVQRPKGRRFLLVYVVTISSDVESSLRNNLKAALSDSQLSSCTLVWIPLMGTGDGRLPPTVSLKAILDVLEQTRWPERGATITIAASSDMPERDFSQLQANFDNWLKSGSARPDDEVINEPGNEFDFTGSVNEEVRHLLAYSFGFDDGRKRRLRRLTTTLILFGLSESQRPVVPEPLSGAREARSFSEALAHLSGSNYQASWDNYFGPNYRPAFSSNTYNEWVGRLSGNVMRILFAAKNRATGSGRSKIALDDLISTLLEFHDGRFREALEYMHIEPKSLLLEYKARLAGGGPTPTLAIPLLGGPQTDATAVSDLLNRDKLTAALTNLLTMREDTQPFAIGLFGHWGTGKSSQISLLQRRVKEYQSGNQSPRISFVEFNAWKNEKADNLGAVLAQAVVDGFVDDLSYLERLRLALKLASCRNKKTKVAIHRDTTRFWEWLANPNVLVFSLVFFVALVASIVAAFRGSYWVPLGVVPTSVTVGLVAVGNFVRQNLTDWFKKLSFDKQLAALRLPDYSAHMGLLASIHSTLRDICEICLGKEAATTEEATKGKYLVVVVDDLDRCSPKTVKEVFDVVRLVADIPRVVTLVAIDERIAFAAVEKHYDQFGYAGREPAQVARDYLSKILQVSVTLPGVEEKDVHKFVESRLFTQEEISDGAIPNQTAPYNNDATEQAISSSPQALANPSSVQMRDNPGPPLTLTLNNINSSEEPNNLSAPKPEHSSAPRAWPEEKKLFSELAVAYGFANPRQLTRLYQAWKLLKSLMLSDGYYMEKAEQWLRLLFWREWLLQQAAEERDKLVAWLNDDARSEMPAGGHSAIKNEAQLIKKIPKENTRVVDAVLLPACIFSATKKYAPL